MTISTPPPIDAVKVHLIDSLGCALAAFDEKPVRICRDVVLASGGGGATVIGTKHRVAPDLAAFANCAAFRYLDLNDAYVGPHHRPPERRYRGLSCRRGNREGERRPNSSPRSRLPMRSIAG